MIKNTAKGKSTMKINQRRIYKLHTAELKKSKWEINLPLEKALSDFPDTVISLGDNQLIRWIDEINGLNNTDERIKEIKKNIKEQKKKPKSTEVKRTISKLYKDLNDLQFRKDIVFVVMDSKKDYDRANEGFMIDFGDKESITYRRFLGTPGGIKNSTIIYVNEKLYPELKRRLDNGRNMGKELIPAKLEAYQGLVCSGSTPIPEPKGIIVVNDCITHFKEDVILIDDAEGDEPSLTYVNDYSVDHNNSDGCGLMLPEYSKRVNQFLKNNDNCDDVIGGMNLRYAWTKGMIFAFDFIEFAEKVANSYEVVDAWGTVRDVRNAEVILTVSMVKLWDSYSSMEEWLENAETNNYNWSTTKITPPALENVRTTSYQHLQCYDFTEDELQELCKPTMEEFKAVLGMDYQKSILFLAGVGLTEKNWFDVPEPIAKALMIEPKTINDPHIRKFIYNNLKKKIDHAKIGTIRIKGNYAIAGGDLYALAQSIFGLEITGLLKPGEIWHKYWMDKGAEEVIVLRNPMTAKNNIRKLAICGRSEARYWFQYIDTALLFNAFDTSCEALNGEDFDSDTNLVTDDPLLLRKTEKTPTIVCVQRTAQKKIVTEEDIIEANKLAFNDDIGAITNRATAMYNVIKNFDPGSEEWNELEYRIMCCQHYQQASIDRAKGIETKPMPKIWYTLKGAGNSDDEESDNNQSDLNTRIVADKKPVFMRYIYPDDNKKFKQYNKDTNDKAMVKFAGDDIEQLEKRENKTEEMQVFLDNYYRFMPMGINECTVNRICWMFEREFDGYKLSIGSGFDYSVYKSPAEYTAQERNAIAEIYKSYVRATSDFAAKADAERQDKDTVLESKEQRIEYFKKLCDKVCPSEETQANIMLDLCYGGKNTRSCSFVWDLCGNQIIKNLLNHSGNNAAIPVMNENGNIEFCGNKFTMKEVHKND